MARTFDSLSEEMIQEWFGDRKIISKKYDSSQYINPIPAFHQFCDNISPTLTVFFASDGSVFGGFTSRDWQAGQQGQHKRDTKAFIFKLYDQGTFQPKKYPVENLKYAIFCHQHYGPCFGVIGKNVDGTGVQMDVQAKKELSSKGFTVTTAIGFTYGCGKLANEDFLQIGVTVKRFEVFQVIEYDGYEMKAWRNVSLVSVKKLKSELTAFQPPSDCDHVNILLVGQIGAGKSSYLNSVISSFKGHVTSTVNRGSSKTSLTQRNEVYRIMTGPERKELKFRFWDTRGLEAPYLSQTIDEIIHILEGNPPNKMSQLVTWMMGLVLGDRPSTSDQELVQRKVHCVVYIIDGTVLSVLPNELKENFEKIKTFANSCGLPQVVLLTKIDKVCPIVNKNLAFTFHSQAIKDLVEQAADMVGLPRAHVFPIKNYEEETDLEENVDRLLLVSVRQMLRFTENFIDRCTGNS